MNIKSIFGAICACLAFLSFNADAALIGRLAATPGGTDYQAYYDDVANLTWLADAMYARTSGFDIDGRMTWPLANAWTASLNIDGVTGWRLPNTIDVGNDGYTSTNPYQGVDAGYNITTHSELSNMFYNVLGNTALYDINGTKRECLAPTYCLENTGPFTNLIPAYYWSSTGFAPSATDITATYFYNHWYFSMFHGFQSATDNISAGANTAWAVHSGDVAPAVPVPAAIWLFGSGLVGLIGLARCKKA